MPTAVGSSTTSYLPGRAPFFRCHCPHFRTASSAMRSDSIVFQSAPSSRPLRMASAVRIVSVYATLVLLFVAESPLRFDGLGAGKMSMNSRRRPSMLRLP